MPYILIAHTHDGEFIGGCSIKHSDGELAEVGFMLVDKKYRRLGLAEYMTQSRISYAQYLGAKMLYAKVREKNIKSMNNLCKAGFRSAGNFLSQKDLYSTISWLYLPLKPMPHNECCQRLRKKLVNLVSVTLNQGAGFSLYFAQLRLQIISIKYAGAHSDKIQKEANRIHQHIDYHKT